MGEMKTISPTFWRDRACVLVTGASSGIGQALAKLLASQGAKLGLLARREPLLDELTKSIRARGGRAAYAAVDVSRLDAVQAAVDALEGELGPCDVLVANAGIYRKTNGRQFDAAVAAEVIAVNLQGAVHTIGAVLPGMVRQGRGRLAAVASTAGGVGLPGAAAYTASKAGLIRLMESLRVDLLPLGIGVTTICPGYVDTPLLRPGERVNLSNLLTAEDTARRIAWAIERGRHEYWFPWQTALAVRIARHLPYRLYNYVMGRYPEMEET